MKTEADYKKISKGVDYNPLSGEFYWNSTHRTHKGKRAGSVNTDGYLVISRKNLMGHRLAWFVYYGELLREGETIDHINGVKTDNRIANLEKVSVRENTSRRSLALKTSNLPLGVVSNLKGRGKDYRARAVIDGKLRHLGYYDTPEQAHQAYLEAINAR